MQSVAEINRDGRKAWTTTPCASSFWANKTCISKENDDGVINQSREKKIFLKREAHSELTLYR